MRKVGYLPSKPANDGGTLIDLLAASIVANDETIADPFASFVAQIIREQAEARSEVDHE